MAISDRIAVMNRGELLQVGPPHELYYAPRTLFVAQFIGRANLLPVTVTAASAEAATITLLGESWRVPAPASPPEGGLGKAMVRPEAVGLARRGAGPGIPGKVAEAVFLGEKSEYAVELPGGGRLTVTTSDPALADLRAGDAVALTLRADLIRLFPDASA